MRTTAFKKKTLIAYEVDESSGEPVLNALGVFHGGQDWEAAAANTKGIQGRADDTFVCGKCVAGRPAATDHDQQQPTLLRRSAPHCHQGPTTAGERAAVPLVLLRGNLPPDVQERRISTGRYPSVPGN